MPALKTRRLSRPKILRQIRPSLLVQLLRPYEAYLRQHEVLLPPIPEPAHLLPGDPDPLDAAPQPDEDALGETFEYERLGILLANPNEGTPGDLVDAIHYVSGLITPRAQADVIDAIAAIGTIEPDVEGDARFECSSAEDLAVRLYLQDRTTAERLHNQFCGYSPTRYEYFGVASVEGQPPPARPDLDKLPALDEKLSVEMAGRYRGRGVHVSVVESGDGDDFRFYVRRGELFRREATLRNGKAGMVAYRPLQHDVVGYNPAQRVLRVHTSCGPWLSSLYRVQFGYHLYDDPLLFSPSPRFTLDPLRDGRSCLSYRDTDWVRNVHLIEVQARALGSSSGSLIYRAPDVFDMLRRSGTKLTASMQLLRAKFQIGLHTRERALVVTVEPPNVALFSVEDEGLSATWLARRGFVLESAGRKPAVTALPRPNHAQPDSNAA